MADPGPLKVWGPVRWYVSLSARHPFALLLFYAAISAAAYYPTSKLRLVTDLGALLPQDTPSVRALDESNRRVGSTDLFTIAINGSDPHAIARFQDAVAMAIENGDANRGLKPWKDATWVQVDKPTGFFKKHALYYIPKSDLEKLRDRLEDYFQIQVAKATGMSLLTPEEEEQARKDLVSWFDPELPDKLGLPSQVGRELKGYFQQEAGAKGKDSASEGKGAEAEGDAGVAELSPEDQAEAQATADDAMRRKLPKELRERLLSPDGKTGVVLVRLNRPSTNMSYAQMALDRGTALVTALDPKSYSPDLRAEVVGAYRSFMEVQAVSKDATLATIISLVLVLLLFVAFFRRIRAVAVVMTPLAMGCLWMTGTTGIVYGRLTSITAFVVAMLIGMGIDYGIHLYSRSIDEVQKGETWERAIGIALTHTGRGMLSASGTTVASLLTLMVAHFKGFYEYGVIASYGIGFCCLAAFLVLPPLIIALEKIRPAKFPPLPPATDPSKIFGLDARKAVLWGGAFALLATLVLAPFIGRITFEHDFRNLRAPKTQQTIKYGKAIGKEQTTTPNMILGSSQAEMRVVHQELLRRKHEMKDPRIKSFITAATFVPEKADQEARAKVIAEIGEIANRKAMRKVKDEHAIEMLDVLRDMTTARPFEIEDLPPWVVNMLTEMDGSIGEIGYLYAKVNEWDAISVMQYQDDYGTLRAGKHAVPISSSSFILADVVRTVKKDASVLVFIIPIIILLIVVLDMRSLRRTVAAATALLLGSVWTAGLMGILDIKLGIYNIIAVPTFLGTAIDGAIYTVHHYRAVGPDRLGEVFRVTGRGILAASTTTAAGFIGLLFIQHLGLRTMGALAVTGILASMVAVFLVTPCLCVLLRVKTKDQGGGTGQPSPMQ